MIVYKYAEKLKPTRTLVYKTTATRELKLHIFEPAGHKPNDRRGCFMAHHGGGWSNGNAEIYYPFAEYFAKLGLVGISVEYRLMERDNVTPFECVKDGRSAVRFVKKHAADLGIDPEKLIVTGGSAGAHVAAASGFFEGIDDPADDLSIPCRPFALALYFPVIDTSACGYGNAKCGPAWEQISPLHHVRPGRPPTLVVHSRGDTVTPFVGAQRFYDAMIREGNVCDLMVQNVGPHGHILYDFEHFDRAMRRTASFIRAQGMQLPEPDWNSTLE
jgi:acetyl esterase/lipase